MFSIINFSSIMCILEYIPVTSKEASLIFKSIFIPFKPSIYWDEFLTLKAINKSIISFSYCVQNLVKLYARAFFQFTSGLL